MQMPGRAKKTWKKKKVRGLTLPDFETVKLPYSKQCGIGKRIDTQTMKQNRIQKENTHI